MMSLNSMLDKARDACDAANTANALLASFIDGNAGDMISPAQLQKAKDGITTFKRTMAEITMLLGRKVKERKAKWENTPVLEAVIKCGELTRKIVLAKPNERIDEPFITESFYTAIRNKWKSDEPITTAEDYDILVINRKGKQVNRINRSK